MTEQMVDISYRGTGMGSLRCGSATLPMVISQSMPITEAKPKMLLVSAALIDTHGRVLPNGRRKSMAGFM